MRQLILASASPRRRELLQGLAPEFLVVPSRFEEKTGGRTARETAGFFAQKKAEEVFGRYPDALVLGADTVVALGNEILGKPKDEADAARMLRLLSGKSHSVFTGICLVGKDENNRDVAVRDVVETRVTFSVLTEEFIARYVASGSPMDKAGAYGIQDGGLVERYEGSYTNVVGLPTERLAELFEELGIC